MKKYLAFALNYAQWNVLKQSKYYGDSVFVTDSLRAAQEIEQAGQPLLELSALISVDEMRRNHDESIRLVDTWYLPYLNDIEYERIKLGKVMRRNMWYFYIAILNLLSATKEIFKKKYPKHFILFNDYCEHTVWDSHPKPSVDHLNAVLNYIARKNKIEVTSLSIRSFKTETETSPVSPSQRNNKKKILHHGINNYNYTSRYNILTFLNATDYKEQYPLLQHLGSLPDINNIILKNGDFKVLESKLVLIDWKSLVAFERTRQAKKLHVLHSELKKSWLKFKRHQAQNETVYPEIFSNSSLDFQYKTFWKSLVIGANFIDTWILLCKHFNPGLCIFGTDFEGKAKCLVKVTDKLGITTLTIPHGSGIGRCGHYNMRASESDYVTAIGSFHSELLKKTKITKQKVVNAGSLHYGSQIYSTAESDRSPSKKHQTGRPKVVIFTALANYGLSLCQVDLKAHRSNFNEIAEFAERRTDLEFLIKPHPRYDYYEYYKYLEGQFDYRIKFDRNFNFRNQNTSQVIAVLYNIPSSVYIDIISAGVPVVYYKSSGFETPSLESTLDQEYVVCVRNISELEKLIDNVLEHDEFEEQILSKNKKFLEKCLFHSPEKALVNIDRLIKKILNSSQLKPNEYRARHDDKILSVLGVLNIIAHLDVNSLSDFLRSISSRDNTEQNGYQNSLATIYLNAGNKALISGKYLLAMKFAAEGILKNPHLISTIRYKAIDRVFHRIKK